MPISEAALDGIRDNGHCWRYSIDLRPLTAKLGAMNDGDGGTAEDRMSTVQSIVERVRTFARTYDSTNERMANDLVMRSDDLECVEDCDIEDINCAMNELYDSFDYWRVLAR